MFPHPGGILPILKVAGTDATEAFSNVHPTSFLSLLPASSCIGSISLPIVKRNSATLLDLPHLSSMLNIRDFEILASKILSPEAWAYYSSGAMDEITMNENVNYFRRIHMIPRVLVNVSNISMSTSFFGQKTRLPIYISACALGKLGHPEGEVVLTRAAKSTGIFQMIGTLSSCSLDEILDVAGQDTNTWLQVYVSPNREYTEKQIKHAESRGVKGFFITVDAPTMGKRESDMRMKSADISSLENKPVNTKIDKSRGVGKAISSFIDDKLEWNDLKWLRGITKLPIVLKGIQSTKDAIKAGKSGYVDGIVVSNHGGRQLDTTMSSIEMLKEIVKELKRENMYERLHVYMDGGIRRGSDVYKALAMGARGVGIGRPFLYGMSTFGEEGVKKVVDIIEEELEMCMKLMGVNCIEDIDEDQIKSKL